MKFKFKLNKHYLFVHALRQTDMPVEGWENLQNRLWEKFPKGFYLLAFHPEAAFVGNNPMKSFLEAQKEVEDLFKEAFRSKEFKVLYEEAREYKLFVEREWKEKGEKALKILEELSGLHLPPRNINVLITHPKLYRSFAFDRYDMVSIGYLEDWKNSSVVYLCHEIMHLLTKNTPIMHALIKLMTDNEMRIRLNKKGKYFVFEIPEEKKNDPFYIYEEKIWKLEKIIYPQWQKYLKDRGGKSIVDLERELREKIK